MYPSTYTLPAVTIQPLPQAVESIHLNDLAIKRIFLAIFTRAIMDARLTSCPNDAEDARRWLLEEGAQVAGFLGMQITRPVLKQWIDAGCPEKFFPAPGY